jgi:DNA-directed RNA polymerase specialized sigma24 family protein
MEQPTSKLRAPGAANSTENVLEDYYDQLLTWGSILTRGDIGKAHDIVHDLCLHFTLSRPDLSMVSNLDAYLYTSLRHIYLSSLARSSREAGQFVSVADFDSIESALVFNSSSDFLQRQNDLRRICCYSVWRKEDSKGSCYFILHFFHGYARQEIADLASLPISAIYNKLKTARAEVKNYLAEPGKLRFTNRNLPPEPRLLWSTVPSPELFKELRRAILDARISDCLSQDELLAYYRPSDRKPITRGLLSHIVSCERCLAVLDRHFRRPTLPDREPLDGFGSLSDRKAGAAAEAGSMNRQTFFRSIRRRKGGIYQHRPTVLSIAVDGKIIARHDVRGQDSMLSARIDHPEKVQFVEIFNEQDVRLALLSVGAAPPEGPHLLTQRVPLSDSRWLELNLVFDGLGLNSEVAYFDPALALEEIEEFEEDAPAIFEPSPARSRPASRVTSLSETTWIARFLRKITPPFALAWAIVLACVVCAGSYLAYRYASPPLDAKEILSRSLELETASLKGQTAHEVLQFEEQSIDQRVLQRGTIDVWRDGDGSRYTRRLYDAQHRLIAAESQKKNGERNSYRIKDDRKQSDSGHQLSLSELLSQDVSSRAFNELRGHATRVNVSQGGYELTTVGPTVDRPELVSATLVLNDKLQPVREVIRERRGADIHEIRFVQAGYERRSSVSVPDAVFDLEGNGSHASHQSLTSPEIKDSRLNAAPTEVQLAQLHIAVLYQLNKLGADTAEPIEVLQTTDGHIRVSGSVADDTRRHEISSRLESLANRQLLDVQLASSRNMAMSTPAGRMQAAKSLSVYDLSQTKPVADEVLRRYFQAKGLSGEKLDSAVVQFSHDALEHGQKALQHAYALDRLGSAFPSAELRSISVLSQQQWMEMVAQHATALEFQLTVLHEQLAPISPADIQPPPAGDAATQINTPPQFARAVDQISRQTQELNRKIGSAFASSPSGQAQSDMNSLVNATQNPIPLHEAEQISRFARRLNASADGHD